LSNLDACLRTTMRRELSSLQKKLGITTIYVTHDQTEALSMGDRIALEIKRALKEKQKAWQNFNEFANSYQANYIYWVNSAKREDTRKRRIDEVVARASQNKKPGIE